MRPDDLGQCAVVSVDADEWERLKKREEEYERVILLLTTAGHVSIERVGQAQHIARTFY